METYMDSYEIRNRFINFFTKKIAYRGLDHAKVSSSSLVPERHPTLLFTNSGMIQFTPYFLGEKDPVSDFGNRRLCSIQKCIRTGDLEIVGKSKYHLTFFEMMGSWSIGDYGKKDAVKLAYELLTNKEYGFGLDGSKFIATVFCGNDEVPCDMETIDAWKSVGLPDDRISKLPASENWWSPGGLTGQGPCGPCTEILYDRGEAYGPKEDVPGLTDNPRYLEIWNAGVFMEYNRDETGKLNKLPLLSVDTGAGLERFAVLLQGVDSVYETDLFVPIINKIIELSDKGDEIRNIIGSEGNSKLSNPETSNASFEHKVKSSIQRIADHLRASIFLIGDGVLPSNKDQGYVLRRLIRQSFNDAVWIVGMDSSKIIEIVEVISKKYGEVYDEISSFDEIREILTTEVNSYKKIADSTRNFIIKNRNNTSVLAHPFDIKQSHGASKELIESIADEQNIQFDFETWDQDEKKHQELSRENMKESFKGGLADHSEQTVRYHTATHLLHKALREVLGDHVRQMGSNITPERLRFDFSHENKLTDEQISQIEKTVNEKINQSLPVNVVKMSKNEAEKTGALFFFKEKYADEVTVYYTGENLENAWSKEFCGGPHVKNTKELGKFHIQKEEAVGKGIRRIKAVLEN